MSKLIKTIVLFVTNTFFVRAMHEIGYSGYLSYELCHPLPVLNDKTVIYMNKKPSLITKLVHSILNPYNSYRFDNSLLKILPHTVCLFLFGCCYRSGANRF